MYPVTDTAARLAAKLARIARNSSGPPALRSSASLQNIQSTRETPAKFSDPSP